MEDANETRVEKGAVFIGERYRLLSMLGAGSMGVVYKVRDQELDEVVALKLLQSDVVAKSDAIARFRTEVKLARRVTHSNVARTFDIGKHGDDAFLTMELVEGASLAAKLADEGPFPVERVVDIGIQVCAGLAAAHAVDVVHRDLKPANVMWTPNGRAVITDFGVACLRAERAAGLDVVGTPAFMAPEQLVAEPSIDGRADIFAFGGMLYNVLTNERPFSSAAMPLGSKERLTAAAPDPRRVRADVPDALAAIVVRCLASDRTVRYPSIEEVGAALAALPSSSAHVVTRRQRIVAPPGERRPGVRTVAVVQFHNPGAPTDAYLAAGFTHDLADALGRINVLNVRAVDATATGGGEPSAGVKLAAQLGADAVVEGSVFRIADSVRVTARVVAVENGLQLWGGRMTRPFAELLAVGDEVAAGVAAALTAACDAPLRPSADPVAVDLYLRARASYHEDSRGAKEAPALFERALEHAPDEPTILAGYALALARGTGPFDQREQTVEHERAGAVAERAVSVAPHLAEAHLALARIRYDDAELAATARSLKRALDISARSADAFWMWGWMHAEIGDLALAIARFQHAVDLDPRMTLLPIEMMKVHALLGSWAAVDALGAVAPKNALRYAMLAQRLRLAMWRRDAAAVRAMASESGPTGFTGIDDIITTVVEGRMTAALSDVFAAAAHACRDVPRRLAFTHQLATEYRAFGYERDEALAHLEAADGARLFDINWLDRCPVLDDLRSERRFQTVRAHVAERASAGLAALRDLDG